MVGCSLANAPDEPVLDDDQGGGGENVGGSGDCEGPLTTLEDCGACGVACAPANASGASCDSGSCTYAACMSGFGDCDGDPANGCEQALDTLSHCGGCGVACAPANAGGPSCVNGACGYDACVGSFADCNDVAADGCESDTLSDGLHCGGCGQPCPNGKPCQNGDCGPITVLVLSNSPSDNITVETNFEANIPDIEIDTFDVTTSLPTPALLQSHDVTLLYENGVFANAAAVGNVLHTFVMNGGRLVIGTFYWQDRSSESFGGSWGNLESIDPLFFGSCDYATQSLGMVQSHPLTLGLNAITTNHRGGPNTLRADATAVAWWADGDPLLAFNFPGSGVITMVTQYPPEMPSPPDDYYKLWENALKWTATTTGP